MKEEDFKTEFGKDIFKKYMQPFIYTKEERKLLEQEDLTLEIQKVKKVLEPPISKTTKENIYEKIIKVEEKKFNIFNEIP